MFENELQKNKDEQELIKNSLISNQIAFANKIKNGLGDDIKNTLKNPPKPSYKIMLKFKFKNIIKNLFKVC